MGNRDVSANVRITSVDFDYVPRDCPPHRQRASPFTGSPHRTQKPMADYDFERYCSGAETAAKRTQQSYKQEHCRQSTLGPLRAGNMIEQEAQKRHVMT